MVGGRTYYFRVLANSRTSYESSEEVKFPVPARVKHKAIKAGVVGGFLFFIVAIILSVCAVKICNKRKRRRQEKGIQILISLLHILLNELNWITNDFVLHCKFIKLLLDFFFLFFSPALCTTLVIFRSKNWVEIMSCFCIKKKKC